MGDFGAIVSHTETFSQTTTIVGVTENVTNVFQLVDSPMGKCLIELIVISD